MKEVTIRLREERNNKMYHVRLPYLFRLCPEMIPIQIENENEKILTLTRMVVTWILILTMNTNMAMMETFQVEVALNSWVKRYVRVRQQL